MIGEAYGIFVKLTGYASSGRAEMEKMMGGESPVPARTASKRMVEGKGVKGTTANGPVGLVLPATNGDKTPP